MQHSSRLALTLAFAIAGAATAAGQTEGQVPDGEVQPGSVAPAITAPPVQPKTTPAGIKPDVQAAPVLTLTEAVRRALEQNFDLKVQGFDRETAEDSLTIAKSAFDPELELSTRRSYQQGALGSTVVNGNVVTGATSSVDSDSTRLGVNQLLPTGGVISASGALDRSKTVPLRTLPNPAYDSDVAISLRQPLLRNAGLRNTRAAIERARLGVDIANLDFKSVVLAVIRDVEQAYYNLAFAREQLTVRLFSLDVAQRLLEENRSRAATGVATDLDVLQAEVGVANARRNVLLAQQTVQDREDALLAEIEPFGFSIPLGTVELAEEAIPEINGDRSFKLARDNTPELLVQQTAIEQLKIDKDVARRNRLPTLDVGGALGYNTRQNSYRSAASRVWDGDGYSWSVDATLRFPWGLRADRARYRQSVSLLNREQARLQQIEQNVMVQVRAAVRAVETNIESVNISALATQLSLRQYELEKARYDAGLSTFRRVQEAQEDLDNARVNEVQAKVTLRNAMADLARLEGSSLNRYRVNLEE